MVKVAKEYIGIVLNDGVSLHMFRLADNTETPYVVGFNLVFANRNIASWDSGFYCKNLGEAWEILDAKCIEYDFKLSA